jgi:hypothetical protein
MKLPRFSLRTLFIIVTIAAIISTGFVWRQSQLEWIRQRHEFVKRFPSRADPQTSPCPWHLRIFGEKGYELVCAHQDNADEARKLFPEAHIEVLIPAAQATGQ